MHGFLAIDPRVAIVRHEALAAPDSLPPNSGALKVVVALALYDQVVNAGQFGINLRGNSVRLAVLGGCETGRRDGVNAWSGIAPALIKQQIPAAIANQANPTGCDWGVACSTCATPMACSSTAPPTSMCASRPPIRPTR